MVSTALSADPAELYSAAMHKLRSWSIHEAPEILRLFEQIITADPLFYRAYTGICSCCSWMAALGLISNRAAEEKINASLSFLKNKKHNLPDYYLFLAKRNFWIDHNCSAALRNCSRALELHSSCGEALLLKGIIRASEGKSEPALHLLLQAEMLDPLTPNISYFIGLICFYREEYENALIYFERNIRISPSWHQPYHEKLITLCRLQQFDRAQELIAEFKKRFSLPLCAALMEIELMTAQNRQAESLDHLNRFETELQKYEKPAAPYYAYLAELHLQNRSPEKAFHFLKMGASEKSAPLKFLRLNRIWNPVRHDAAFLQITRDLFTPYRRNYEHAYRKSSVTEDFARSSAVKLEQLMETDEPWLDPHFSRSDCAKLLSLEEYELSEILNRYLSVNFYDYINQFRLRRFLALVQDRTSRSGTTLQKALEAGFSSKSTFNHYFKLKTGLAPREYLAQNSTPNLPG